MATKSPLPMYAQVGQAVGPADDTLTPEEIQKLKVMTGSCCSCVCKTKGWFIAFTVVVVLTMLSAYYASSMVSPSDETFETRVVNIVEDRFDLNAN